MDLGELGEGFDRRGITARHDTRARSTFYRVADFGLRAHLPVLNAAIGSAQLHGFDRLADLDQARLVDLDIGHSVPFHRVVRVPDHDRVFHRLREQGIGVGVHYPPDHFQPTFTAWHRDLPVSEATATELLSPPFHPALRPDDTTTVCLGNHCRPPRRHRDRGPLGRRPRQVDGPSRHDRRRTPGR
ncbi:DegT/DnrJ/EryC1/StrS family aminotransferase [Saccharothrix sp. Mg75]|uniref:DegT/DnrJ/EryC1/StrS family aminotransferase n=1 Tax=Saccharothrix sp. Mg75 TaxID=3445357 RepID=UPI003EEFC076